MMKLIFVLIGLLLWLVLPASAQPASCPAIVAGAVQNALLECGTMETGEICYGNAEVQLEAEEFIAFTRPGDRVPFAAVDVLQTNPMNLDRGRWGLAIVKVEANTPDQILTYVMFGDASLENASAATEPVTLVPVRVREITGANVRAVPDGELLTRLLSGDVVNATARLADNSWLRLRLPDGTDGWVRADLLRAEGGDVDSLAAVRPTDEINGDFYSPLQAFTLRSGIYGAVCSEAPESGLLVQTPSLADIQINGVDIRFDGTLYLQAPNSSDMIVIALEGRAEITSGEASGRLQAGEELRIPVSEDGYGVPGVPFEYAYVEVRDVPLALLPRPVGRLVENLRGVVLPAPRSGTLLDGLTADSTCTVAAVNEVRLRQGPGRDFAIIGRLFPGEGGRPDARAEGTDGGVWWRLTDGVWVRADVVFWEGNCPSLPFIPAPPLPGT